MSEQTEPLSFAAVDGLGFAAARGLLRSLPSAPYSVASLGPLLELIHLEGCGRLSLPPFDNLLAENGAGPMILALKQQRESWLNPVDRHVGFIRADRSGADGDSRLTGFLMDAKRAAVTIAQLPSKASAQLVAAMAEMESNIHEHSQSAKSGLLSFRATQGVFEFVAVDRGIGILESLRSCSAYAALSDHGKALAAALSDGVSRFGEGSRRGHGFRQVFLGLLDLYGSLRFRSGNYALVMDGTSPDLTTAQLIQKPSLDGFFASIRCGGVA